jgi:hypothetical protein
MASEEDKAHAAELLYEYRKRLRVRERQKARQGDAADPSVEIEIAELRLNIATLEALVEPEPAIEVQEAVRAHVADDYMFLFTQFVRFGSRLTHVEQRVETVSQQQGRADVWRLGIADDVLTLKNSQTKNDVERKAGQHMNRALLIAVVVLLVIGLLIGRGYL